MDRQRAFDKVEQRTAVPMLLLAVAMIPALIVPEVTQLTAKTNQALDYLMWLIWAAFALEYSVKLALHPNRWQFVKGNVPDLLIIVLPLLRPLRLIRSARLLRLVRLARLGAFFSESMHELTLVLRRHKLHYALIITLVLLFVAAGLVVEFEKDVPAPERTINSIADGSWWAISTITTVGYGDTYPKTPAGKGVAVFLMVTGIVFFSLLTANIAAVIIESDRQDEPQDAILERLDRIEEALLKERERLR